MKLEGRSLKSWSSLETLELMAQPEQFKAVMDTIKRFQADTGRVHGDFHVGNILRSTDRPGQFVLADLERAILMDNITGINDRPGVRPALALIDRIQVVRGLFDVPLDMLRLEPTFLLHQRVVKHVFDEFMSEFEREEAKLLPSTLTNTCKMFLFKELGGDCSSYLLKAISRQGSVFLARG